MTGIPTAAPLDGELLRTKDLSTPFAGVEELATGGVVILVGDLNLLSNIEDEVGNDNHRFFLNLAPAAPVFATPGLGTAAGAVLAGLLAALGRRRARLPGCNRLALAAARLREADEAAADQQGRSRLRHRCREDGERPGRGRAVQDVHLSPASQ